MTKKLSRKTIDTTETIRVKVSPVAIDFDEIENRLEILPIAAGNYRNLSSVKGKLLYMKYPLSGSDDKPVLKIYDFDKKEEKTILEKTEDYTLSADRQKMLVRQDNKFAIIKPEADQKFEKPLAVGDMQMFINPMNEWKQIFNDAWRFERDYFYDPDMHGVNWKQAKEQYAALLAEAATREELNFILGEMIGELNASHTYQGGGDVEDENNLSTGYLGVDFEAVGEYYKIKQIIRGAPWDAETRSPLLMPGVSIREGDYLLAVNGTRLTALPGIS